MKPRNLIEYDPLEYFLPRKITLAGSTKLVHVAGDGPAVMVIPEIPGLSPHVARFGRWVRDAGFTVYMLSLYGRDGEPIDLERVIVSAKRSASRRTVRRG